MKKKAILKLAAAMVVFASFGAAEGFLTGSATFATTAGESELNSKFNSFETVYEINSLGNDRSENDPFSGPYEWKIDVSKKLYEAFLKATVHRVRNRNVKILSEKAKPFNAVGDSLLKDIIKTILAEEGHEIYTKEGYYEAYGKSEVFNTVINGWGKSIKELENEGEDAFSVFAYGYSFDKDRYMNLRNKLDEILGKRGLTRESLKNDAEDFIDRFDIRTFDKNNKKCTKIVEAFATYVYRKYVKNDPMF